MSQEYTPVDWVDETPTQPGTLINKERLDQMQSAHHFADGFEEVDAIPTADPGVDYHKVVYCTADSTFYRWDGTQWTADIDDDTKRLLLEHEADHSNPHAVTKAQVGLGNADNTSDADKPISTATQAALDLKANDNAVVHLTGDEVLSNGVKANTTAGSSSASATKDVPPRFVVQSTGFDRTVLQGVNRHYPVAGLNDKNGKPVAKLNISTTDAAIYAYLQAIGTDEGQATLEIGKFDRTTKTWSPTMVNDALDSYATMVRTVNNQTINGIKTFLVTAVNNQKWRVQNNNEGVSTVPASQVQTQPLDVSDANGTQIYFDQILTNIDGSRVWRQNLYGTGGHRTILHMQVNADGTSFLTAPARAYNASNTSDVVTLGLLDGYTPMVRTTGAQTIAGIKTFTSNPVIQSSNPNYILKNTEMDVSANPSTTRYALVFAKDKNDAEVGSFGVRKYDTGLTQWYTYIKKDARSTIFDLTLTDTEAYIRGPSRAYNASNTSDVVTIATLDAYTPMVRTTGNQEIIGVKAFSMPNYGYTLAVKDTGLDITNIQSQRVHSIPFLDKNGVAIANVRYVVQTTGEILVQLEMRKTDGTFKYINLGDNS